MACRQRDGHDRSPEDNRVAGGTKIGMVRPPGGGDFDAEIQVGALKVPPRNHHPRRGAGLV